MFVIHCSYESSTWCNMSVANNSVFYYLLYLVSLGVVTAPPQSLLSDVQRTKLTDHFTTHGVDCIGEYKINFEDIRALRAFEVPKSPEAPCFFACILKMSQLMNAEGKIAPEAVLKVARKVFDNPKDLTDAVEVFASCAYVNEKEVTDGTKGCDRAMLALTCLTEQSTLPDDAPDAAAGVDDVTVNRRVTARRVLGSIVNSLLQVSCLGVVKVTETFPLKILSDFIPVNQGSSLCRLIVSSIS